MGSQKKGGDVGKREKNEGRNLREKIQENRRKLRDIGRT
jgi:hypothetical protein